VPNCERTSVGYVPLPDLGSGTYQGCEGGLYPEGANEAPADYVRAGSAHARAIRPRNQAGEPDRAGKIVLLSIGMSNATMEFSTFQRHVEQDPGKHPSLVLVDGAQGGQTAASIKEPDAAFWNTVERRLNEAGASAQQVQLAWLKEANPRPTEPFPVEARRLQQDLRGIVEVAHRRYPHLHIIFLSSRTYGGYASTPLNPEPHAYESGFAVKWLIEERIRGELSGPWLAWGPYLWTDGAKGRSDGLVWTCDDVARDGTHPSVSGMHKVAGLLVDFFTTDETARRWFVR